MTHLPLSGIRIIAVEQYGAGPYGTQLLADLGAEVIKIENPGTGGDVSRFVSPHRIGDTDSQFFQTFNRNKKSLSLDLKDAQGRAQFEALVKTADAVFAVSCPPNWVLIMRRWGRSIPKSFVRTCRLMGGAIPAKLGRAMTT